MYEFYAAIFIKVLSYQSFDVKCLLLSWDAFVYRHAKEWQKIGGVWFSLLINKLIDSQKRKVIYENFDCIQILLQFVLDFVLILALTNGQT